MINRLAYALDLRLIAGTVALAGCSVEERAQSNGNTDIRAAALDAQGDIDTYAANSLTPDTPRATPSPAPLPSPEPVAVVDDGKAAATVVRRYFDLIAARRYDQAWGLWSDGGRASGMNATDFAASFDRYASYQARVGAPGRVDAGAGQRYVQVPVRVTGQLADDGGPFALVGALTLHRVADIDGATTEQRSWRIRDSSLRPRPAQTAAALPGVVQAAYRCAGKTRITVRFDNRAGTVTVADGDRDVAVLDQQRAGSGIWYKGGGYELRGKGRDADYTTPGQPAVACSAD